jgi:hypothetical protein
MMERPKAATPMSERSEDSEGGRGKPPPLVVQWGRVGGNN